MTNPIQQTIFALLLLAAFFGGKHWFAVAQPDAQGCEVVKTIGGWKECHLVDRTAWLVGVRGCDGRDAHLYKVAGTLPSGESAEAIVCCGAFFKGCTIRAMR